MNLIHFGVIILDSNIFLIYVFCNGTILIFIDWVLIGVMAWRLPPSRNLGLPINMLHFCSFAKILKLSSRHCLYGLKKGITRSKIGSSSGLCVLLCCDRCSTPTVPKWPWASHAARGASEFIENLVSASEAVDIFIKYFCGMMWERWEHCG
jgi:hypothetical protein